ncbi:hypothetical protein [Pseudomonas aeruginosa]|uniref:hypothetical protein n=1 Tax=Pseudomonas aeruginosa TaxID=287 RepID=UPI0020C87BBC|nr:hypothetical protein [Pseudomonas aeruginosa]
MIVIGEVVHVQAGFRCAQGSKAQALIRGSTRRHANNHRNAKKHRQAIRHKLRVDLRGGCFVINLENCGELAVLAPVVLRGFGDAEPVIS